MSRKMVYKGAGAILILEAPASGDKIKFRERDVVKGAGAIWCKLLLLAEILATMLVAGLFPLSVVGSN